MFRIKCIVIVLIAALIAGAISGFVYLGKTDLLKSYTAARDEYKKASDINYELEEKQYQEKQKNITSLQKEIYDIKHQIDSAAKQYNDAQEANQTQRVAYLEQAKNELKTQNANNKSQLKQYSDAFEANGYKLPSSEAVYSNVLAAVTNVENAELVMFVPDEDTENAYTVKYVGFSRGLSEVLNNLSQQFDTKKIRFSIGNYSLRQVYDAFSNEREWDETTMLNWYDDSYITSAGAVAKILGGYRFRDVQITGGTHDSKEEIAALEQAKESAIAQNNLVYNAKMNNITALREAKLVEAANSGNYGNNPSYEAFKENLYSMYKVILDGLEDERKAENNKIEADYNARISEIGESSQDEEYYDPSNPDLLIYVLDITFSVDPGELPFDVSALLK